MCFFLNIFLNGFVLGLFINFLFFNVSLIDFAKYLLENKRKTDDMVINLIQIFRQMVFHNYFPMHDKLVYV